MRFYYRAPVTLISVLFALGAFRLSFWQFNRHAEKINYIQLLNENLNKSPVQITSLIDGHSVDPKNLYRRVQVQGRFDYEHEVVLRNRRYERQPGVFVITPLHIDDSQDSILVNRGFVPLRYAEREDRKKLQRPEVGSFTGILKEKNSKKLFAPSDPSSGGDNPWVDAWLRIDIDNIQKQIPYPLLPLYVEGMPDLNPDSAVLKIVQGESGRDDMFVPSERTYSMVSASSDAPPEQYPIPILDTVVPPDRHFGYIFEWIFIGLLALGIGCIIQLKPPYVQKT